MGTTRRVSLDSMPCVPLTWFMIFFRHLMQWGNSTRYSAHMASLPVGQGHVPMYCIHTRCALDQDSIFATVDVGTTHGAIACKPKMALD